MRPHKYDRTPSDEMEEVPFSADVRSQRKCCSLKYSLNIIAFGLVVTISIIFLEHEASRQFIFRMIRMISGEDLNPSFKREYTDQMVKMFGVKRSNSNDRMIFNRSYEEYGLNEDVQIGSVYDYMNITGTPQYQNFQNNHSLYFKNEIYDYPYQSSLQKQREGVSYSYFASESKLKDYLYGMYEWNGNTYEPDTMLHIFMVTHFIWNFSEPRVRAVEYYFYDKKYSITQVEKQIQVCVFMSGHNIFSKNAYGSFFQSVEKQNYSNYKVIIVDDNSTDDSTRLLHTYLSTKDYRLKNRIVLVRNFQRIGILGNLYYYTRKYCDHNSIIVPIDPDEAFIGSQIFNVLNRLYHNPENWCVYSNHIEMKSPMNIPKKGRSRNFTLCMDEYRNFFDHWFLAHFTFRYELLDSIPIQAFVEYHYEENVGVLMPRFYEVSQDTFLFLSFMELGGNKKVLYLDDFLYWYTGNPISKCQQKYKDLNGRKARLKKTFKIKNGVDDVSEYIEEEVDYKTTQNLERLWIAYQKYKEECASNNK